MSNFSFAVRHKLTLFSCYELCSTQSIKKMKSLHGRNDFFILHNPIIIFATSYILISEPVMVPFCGAAVKTVTQKLQRQRLNWMDSKHINSETIHFTKRPDTKTRFVEKALIEKTNN